MKLFKLNDVWLYPIAFHMKIAFLTMSVLLFFSYQGRSEEPPTLVRAVVIDLQKVPEEKLSDGGDQPLLDQQILWKAFLKIDAVYQGHANINGETMSLITSDHIPLGNTRSIIQKLQMGDVGIFAIEPLRKKGQWRRTYLQPVINGVALPLIKGRQADYDRILLFLAGINEQKKDASSHQRFDIISPDKKMCLGVAGRQSSTGQNIVAQVEGMPTSRFIWFVLAVLISLSILICFGWRAYKKIKPD